MTSSKSSRSVLLSISLDRRLSGDFGHIRKNSDGSDRNLRICVEHILESETWGSESGALKLSVDAGKLAWSIVGQGVCDEGIGESVDEDAGVLVVDVAAGKNSRARVLQFDVGDADIAGIFEGARGVGVLLRLHDFVEDAVDVG